MRPAKVTRPKHVRLVPRDRLFQVLDDAPPAVWLYGLPGAGKTCLVSSYIDARGLPPLWYHLDAGDDPATLFHYLDQAAPKRKRPLPRLSPEQFPSLRIFARRYFEELFSRLKAPACVVFDDCHEAQVDELLAEAVTSLPEGVRLFLISRAQPTDALAPLLAKERLSALGGDDLQLTAQEAQTMGLEASHGWAAGLAIQDLESYFQREIFERADPATQQVLLKTALLPDVDAEAAQALSGDPQAPAILQRLYRHSLFTAKRGQRYQYHPLFRTFLLERAQGLSDLADLQCQAADLLLLHDEVDQALDLLRAAENWEKLAEVGLGFAERLIKEGRFAVVERALAALPDFGEPWIHFWLGVSRLPFRPQESMALLQQAAAAFEERGEDPGAALAWSALMDAIVLEGRAYDRMDPWLERYDTLVRWIEELPTEELQDLGISALYQTLALRRPTHPDFASWEGRALDTFHRSTEPTTRARVAFSYLFRALGDDVAKARVMIDACRSWARSAEASPFATLFFRWFECAYHLVECEPQRCRQLVEEALAYAEQTGVPMQDVVLLGQAAIASTNAGEFEIAEGYVERMSAHPLRHQPRNLGNILFCQALLAFRRGSLSEALLLAEQSQRTALELDDLLISSLCQMCQVCVLAAQRNWSEMEVRLEVFREMGEALAQPSHRWVYLLLRAYMHLEQGHEPELAEALRMGREKSFVGFFVYYPELLERLFAYALAHDLEREYVCQFIERRAILPSQPPLERAAWPWRVEVRSLGTFEVTVRGSVVRLPKKPREMLGALVALGARNVDQEDLSEALWPDADGDAAAQAFKVTLHRLRQSLGESDAVLLRDGRVSLNPRLCWVDVWSVEGFLERARLAPEAAQASRAFDQALALYAPSQGRLEERLLNTAREVASRLEREGNSAAELMARTVELCPQARANWFVRAG